MVRLYVAGKTRRKSGERLVPILRSYNLMRMWLSEHPRSDDPDAWLWTFGKEPLGETNLRMLVWNLMKKAKVSKPRNPYIFRHSALTRFYRDLPGTVASKLAGHAPGSKEAATYTHLSAEDLENAVRTLNGVQKKENVESFKCHKCDQTLGIGDRLCPACGLAQDSEVALKVANETQSAVDFMKGLDVLSVQNPELKELKDKMKELVSKMLDKESRPP
jgi:hypothetical protein